MTRVRMACVVTAMLAGVVVTGRASGQTPAELPELPDFPKDLSNKAVSANQEFDLSNNLKSSLEDEALKGDCVAALRVAQYYGMVDINVAENAYWLQIAAEDGNPVAQNYLGMGMNWQSIHGNPLHKSQEMLERDEKRSAFWIKKSKAKPRIDCGH